MGRYTTNSPFFRLIRSPLFIIIIPLCRPKKRLLCCVCSVSFLFVAFNRQICQTAMTHHTVNLGLRSAAFTAVLRPNVIFTVQSCSKSQILITMPRGVIVTLQSKQRNAFITCSIVLCSVSVCAFTHVVVRCGRELPGLHQQKFSRRQRSPWCPRF